MSSLRSKIKQALPYRLRTIRRNYQLQRMMPGFPDRQYMTAEILPAFKALNPKTVLFIGTQIYTKDYEQWFRSDACEYWTMDVDPEVKCWGAKGKHITASAVEVDAHFAAGYFDIVFFNGVLGWGIDERAEQERALTAIHQISKPNGILLLGWNHDCVTDPLQFDSVRAHFSQGLDLPLPARKTFPDSTHVYDFLVSR